MKVPYIPEGLEAIIFTADGDMRQALNNLQATHSGFHFVNQENVFKVTTQNWCITLVFIVSMHLENLRLSVVFQVCDQPHPLHVKNMVRQVLEGKFDDACSGLKHLYDMGYSPTDIITTLFRIIKNYDMAEYLKLEFMKVKHYCLHSISFHLFNLFITLFYDIMSFQETGFAHMRICDGVGSYLQLCGLLAKLALVRDTARAA